MSLVDIRVELPGFSLTLNVQVPDSSTILDVKHEIHRVCDGAPRVEGQRLIWRGRPLLDSEKVQELWKSPNEPRILHLAVHPSAWTSLPRTSTDPVPSIPPTPLLPPNVSTPSFTVRPIPPATSPSASPMTYVSARHQQALNALEQLKVSSLDADTLAARTAAVQAVERHGWSWPPILDEEFPPASQGGVKYERTIVEGQSYLRLVESADQPTAIQLHALNVLALTFPILAIPVTSPAPVRVATSQPVPAQVNALLQQLGIPAAAVRNANANLAQNFAQNVNIAVAQPPPAPELPLRPLLLPLFLLFLRTAILLYFFAPARKPVFGILIAMWVLYEVWRPIREGLMRNWNRAAAEQANQHQHHHGHNHGHQQQQQQQQPQPQGNAAAGPAGRDANAALAPADRGQDPVAPRPGAVAANDLDQQVAAVFDGLANFNIQNEEDMLRRGVPAEEPGLGSKIMAFVSLLLTTLHPAVWNRRRAVLRQREARIRIDANARAAELDENDESPEARARMERQAQLIAQHEQRPRWLRGYVDRVVEAAWVDEAD